MKHLLLTTIAALVLVGCGVSEKKDIWNAAASGDTNTIELLFALGQNVNAKTKFMETPLHLASENGQKEAADLLIDKGANVNAYAKWERTPLHGAAKTGQKCIIELLIKAGANVNSKDFDDVYEKKSPKSGLKVYGKLS